MDTSIVSLKSACLAPSPEPNLSRLCSNKLYYALYSRSYNIT